MRRFAMPLLVAVNVMVAVALAGQGMLDVNLTSKANLEALKGVGPVWAEAIVKGRPYKDKDDLIEKRIVPVSVYNDIKDKIIARQLAFGMS